MRTGHKLTISVLLTTAVAIAAIPVFAQDYLFDPNDDSYRSGITYAQQSGLGQVEISEAANPSYSDLLEPTELPLPSGPELVVSSVEVVGCEEGENGEPICGWVVLVSNLGMTDAPASTMNVLSIDNPTNNLTDLPAIPAQGSAYSNQFITTGYNPFVEIHLDINDEVAEVIETNNNVAMYLEMPAGG
jgi:hypothetical protein